MHRCDKFYDSPTLRSARTTSFGYGKRCAFQKTACAGPSPDCYTLASDFDSRRTKAHVYTFGACREAYRKVYIKQQAPSDAAIPGPGTYDTRGPPGQTALKYSMRPKTPGTIAT